MGFIIQEPVAIQNMGLELPNLYASLKGEYSITRTPWEGKYFIVSNLFLFTNASATMCLSQQRVHLEFMSPDYPSDPIAVLYAHCKTLFPGKTCVDA